MKGRFRWGHEAVLLGVLVAEWWLFFTLGPRFGSLDNQYDILRHSVEIGLLALAMTPVILTGGIDLSVGSTMGLCAVVFGKLWRDGGWPVGAAAAAAVAAGGLAGGLNAVLMVRRGLPPLIVTLGTWSLYRGLAEALTRGVDTFTGFPRGFLVLGQERWLGVPAQLPWFLLVAAGIGLWVHGTTHGRGFRAIGFTPEGAFHAGVPVRFRQASVYVVAGLVAGVAAIIYSARLGQARADAGTGYELSAITAAVLGGASIFGGTGSVPGTALGVLAIAVLNNGLVHARQPREVAGMLTGVLLLVVLATEAWVRWRGSRANSGFALRAAPRQRSGP